MLLSEPKRLLDRYRPLFLGLALGLICLPGWSQTYNPATCCTVSNKSYGAAQAVTTDGRSWFYDATNFVMRDYNGTSEVLSYLNLAKYRAGHFPIYVHSGGILQSNGVWIGGTTLVYWFKDSTGNANLVRWYTDSTGIPGGPFFAVANNLSEGNAGLIKGNLSLDLVDNTSDAQKNAAAVSLTNHTIDGSLNTLQNIPNSALTNNSIGLTINANPGSDIQVTTTPAALGASLGVNIPDAGTASRGALKSVDWNFFNGKLDSVHVSNDSVYNCVNGTCTLQSVLTGTGGVNSVNGTNASLLFSPTTGNVLGQVNPAFNFNWSGQHTFLSFAPIFSTLTTNGGIYYGNGSGQLLQSGAGTAGQIFQSNGGSAPTFFTPDATTVAGWLGYTPLSNSLASARIFVGNGSNIASAVLPSGDWTIDNAGINTIGTNKVSNAKLAQMPTMTIKGNITGSTANAADLTVSQVQALLGNPPLDSVLKAGNHTKMDIIFDTIQKATSQGYTFRPLTFGWRTDDSTATIGYYPMTFTPYDPQRGNFVFNWGSAANINDPATGRDEALAWGYNIDNSMPTDAHAKWEIESNWTQSGQNQLETYYEIQLKNGAVIRPLFITSNKTDSTGQITMEGTVYSLEDPRARFPLLGMNKNNIQFQVIPQGTFAIRDTTSSPNTDILSIQLTNNGPIYSANGPNQVVSHSFNNAVAVHNSTNNAAGGSMEVQLYAATPYGYSAFTSGTLAGSVYPIYFSPSAVTVDSRIYNTNSANNADNVFRISANGRNAIYGLYDNSLGKSFTQEFHPNGDFHTLFKYDGNTVADFDNAASLLTIADSVALSSVPTGLNSDATIVIGSDNVLRKVAAPLTGSAALDFPSTSAGTSSDLTITVTGAADGDIVSLGVPNAATAANSAFTAWVSATNTVTVRFNNYSSGAIDPSSGTFKVKVSK